MKLTWKNNQNKNKRSLATISLYPNLPFEQDQGQTTTTSAVNSDEEPPKADVTEPKVDVGRKTLASNDDETAQLAEDFRAQGNKLAEDGRYHEALNKWEAALTLRPERAVLHEQKAQVLLEIGEAWSALKAAIRATELEPSWAEDKTYISAEQNFKICLHYLSLKPDQRSDARVGRQLVQLDTSVIYPVLVQCRMKAHKEKAWITLGRAQLNFGEPDTAIESFDRALALKPDSVEGREDRQSALHLVKKRKQLQSSGLSADENRFVVGDKTDGS